MNKIFIVKFAAACFLIAAAVVSYLLRDAAGAAFAVFIPGAAGASALFALASAIRGLEDLKEEVASLRCRVNELEGTRGDKKTSFGVWRCRKCGALNKPGAAACSECFEKYKS